MSSHWGFPTQRSDYHGELGAPVMDRGPYQTFMLATGIECSYPTVEHGKRRDELAETGHYEHWRHDFELCREIGTRYVRYGPPYYRMHLGPHRYDWSYTDEVLPAMWNMGLIPIIDLCHFGVPDWVGGFQDGDWPKLFADYAAAFAERYPWIKFYTPVNEILVCARFSGKLGFWNEQKTSDKAMVRAHATQCKATLLAIEAILPHRPDAVFIQSEAAEVFFEGSPEARDEVRLANELRFITFDFLYGRPPDGDLLVFLFDNGADQKTYEWFMQHGRRAAPHCVMGMDYYASNERVFDAEGQDKIEGVMLGWAPIALSYYQRYRRPMMLTETNTTGDRVQWLWRTWRQANYLRHEGVPVLGYTWFSLTDQVDWKIQLREIRGEVDPNGLVTLDRTIRDVGYAFQQLCRSYSRLPMQETAAPIGLQYAPSLRRQEEAGL